MTRHHSEFGRLNVHVQYSTRIIFRKQIDKDLIAKMGYPAVQCTKLFHKNFKKWAS